MLDDLLIAENTPPPSDSKSSVLPLPKPSLTSSRDISSMVDDSAAELPTSSDSQQAASSAYSRFVCISFSKSFISNGCYLTHWLQTLLQFYDCREENSNHSVGLNFSV